MVQTQNSGQDTVQITRRKLLGLIAASALISTIVSSGLYTILSNMGYQQQREGLKRHTANQTSYISTPEQETKTITITETKTYTQPPVTKTVTKTETITETVTKTVTETRTETLTTPSPTTTTTTTVQRPRTLEEVLFGNSNLKFIPLRILDAKVVGNNVYLRVENPYTKAELEIEIPVEYVSRNNINMADIVSSVRKYNSDNKSNYSVYLILGRANINNAIEQDGKWKLDASKIYYNIIISDKDWKDVYNTFEILINRNALVLMPTLYKGPYPNSLWGWSNQPINSYNNVIIVFQNEQQINEATNSIKLASYILGKPNDENPSKYGILNGVTVVTIDNKGTYEYSAAIVSVDRYMGTYIVFMQQKGNYLVSDL